MKEKTRKTLEAIQEKLAKNPKFADQALKFKELILQAEMKDDQKEFFQKTVELMSQLLEKSKEGVTAKTPNDLMVQNVETASLMVETMKEFIEVVGDKEIEQGLSDQLKSLTAQFFKLGEDMKAIASKKIPAPVVNVEAPRVEVKVPDIIVPEQKTTVIQETEEAKQQTGLLSGLFKLMKGGLSVKVENYEPKDAVPVRIVDKGAETFIDAFMSFVAGGGGPRSVQVSSGTVTPSTTGVLTAQTTAAPVAQSATAVTALAANTDRNFATIVNNASSRMHVRCGSDATANDPDYLDYGDTWTTPIMKDGKVYSGIITIIWEAAGSGNALISEI